MFRSIVLHDIPPGSISAMERWYWRDHSPEIVRRYGVWSSRHDSYLPVPVPDEVSNFGFHNWRLTEGWWRELPTDGPQGTLSFTPPPVWPNVCVCYTPWQPTDDFHGAEQFPGDFAPVRWFVMHRYPDGVSVEEGEDWFLNTHAKEVCEQPGLKRFFSYKTVSPGRLPGTWAPGAAPPSETFSPVWHRVSELWYDSIDAWKKAVIESPPPYTKPDWASSSQYPFFQPMKELVCSFILERPTDEFHRDSRGYL